MYFRKWLLACTALSLTASAAWAQASDTPSADSPSTDSNGTLEELVVKGTQLSRKRAIEEKKDAIRVSDVLGTDELGQLPDKNVGESLNRLPGVSMLVEKGEGRYVQIRGINPALNNVTINGVSMGSPEAEGGGRQAPLDIISGGVLGAVQVVKTPTPDMDAQGIGGTVNVETKMPFDREDDLYGYASARYGFEGVSPEKQAYAGHDPYALDGTLSGKLADGTIGWLLGANYSNRAYIATGIYQDDWTQGDNGLTLPVEVKNNYYVIGRERINLNGALEFRPDSMSKYYVRGFYAKWNEYQHRNRYQQSLTEDLMSDDGLSGTDGLERVSPNIRLEHAHKTLFSATLGGENMFDDFTLSYLVQTNQNKLDEPNDSWEFRSGTDFGPNSWVVNPDGVVTITPDASAPDRQDASLIDFRRVGFTESSMDEDGYTGQVDLKWDYDATTSFKTGAKFTRTERDRDYSQERWNAGADQLTLGTSESFTKGAFMNSVGKYDVPNIWMDIDAMNDFFADPANAGYFELDDDNSFVEEYSSDYSLSENVYAGYVMGTTQMGIAEIIGGLRMEATDISSSGYLLEDGEAQTVDGSSNYINWLPALLVNIRPDDAVVLRGAVTRALGRPDYDSIAPRSSYSEETGFGDLSIGNPDLKARTSWNFDLSAEWYPNDLTLFSAALFYKDISNELVGTSERYTDPADIEAALEREGLGGAVDTADLTELNIHTTINAGSSTLKGIELNAQTQFSFLPGLLSGLGASASATFLDGSTKLDDEKLPLLEQPKTTYAFTLFYQRGGVDASMSYSYNANYLTDVNLDDHTQDLNQGKFGRLDAKVSYEVRQGLKLFVEGVNLNNEPTSEFMGGNKSWNTEYEYVGRTVYIGASFGFGS